MGKALSGELSCPCDRSCYPATFTKEDHFLFASLADIDYYKLGLILKERICSYGSKFFPLRVDIHLEVRTEGK